MSNRKQILRFDITIVTVDHSCIDLEGKTCSLVSSPHTYIIHVSIHQTTFAVVFIHQIFFTNIFKESQTVTTICCTFTQSRIVETAIQRSIALSDSKYRSSCFSQYLSTQQSIFIVVDNTSFIQAIVINQSIITSQIFTLRKFIVFFEIERSYSICASRICRCHDLVFFVYIELTSVRCRNRIKTSFQLSQCRNISISTTSIYIITEFSSLSSFN